MIARAKLSPKFQISIPQEARKSQGWQAGQEFVFIPRGLGMMVMQVPKLEELRGLARGADPTGYRDRKDRF